MKRKSKNQFVDESVIIHGDRYDYSLVNYINNKTKIKIICNKHGEFEQYPQDHLKGHGCKICAGNKKHDIQSIKKIIGDKYSIISNSYINNKTNIKIKCNKNNIIYKKEKKFNNCRNINLLPFDFYLPDYRMCIEYDGRQHYEVSKFFGGEDGFDRIIKNDKIKTFYCDENNINLLRISYKDYDNINEIIKNKLYNYEIE